MRLLILNIVFIYTEFSWYKQYINRYKIFYIRLYKIIFDNII